MNANRDLARDIAGILIFVGLALAAAFLSDIYTLGIITNVLVFVTLAAAWHLAGGYLGQLSIGHSALFGAGAYAAAIIGTDPDVPILTLLLLGCAGGVAVALAITPAFRARGIYFAIITLGVTGLLQVLAVYAAPGGELGIVLPFRFDPFSDQPFYWALGIAVASLSIIRILMWTRHGRAIRAVRDDQEAASALGTDPLRYKCLAFAISAALTGAAGAFYAVRTSFIDPITSFDVMLNVRLILMAIMGGMGTFWGPVIGAVVLVCLDEVFRVTLGAEAALITYAVALIVLMLWFPNGLASIPWPASWWRGRGRAGNASEPAEDVSTLPPRNVE